MTWQEKIFENFRLYGVTNLIVEQAAVLRKIEQAYQGGTDIIQLRSKVLPDAALMRLGSKIRKIAARHRRLFFINDRVDLALAIGADGVHLGQDDMPIATARRLIRRAGCKIWIGKSTHNLRQALEAEREGADYIGVGPVFATPTKPYARSVGLDFVRQAAAKIRIPWVAIGGIDLENLVSVLQAGASRVAVVRAVFSAKDPGTASLKFKYQLERH